MLSSTMRLARAWFSSTMRLTSASICLGGLLAVAAFFAPVAPDEHRSPRSPKFTGPELVRHAPLGQTIRRASWVACWMSRAELVLTSPRTASSATRPPMVSAI